MNKIARGVLHGCIGTCCSMRYPSVFTSIDDREIWNFIYDVPENGKYQISTNLYESNTSSSSQNLLVCQLIKMCQQQWTGINHGLLEITTTVAAK